MAMNEEEKSKSSSIFQTIGTILLFISFFLIFSGLGFIPGFPPDQNFLNIGMVLIAPAFLILFLSILTGVNKDLKKSEVFTTIKCRNSSCKHVLIRDFKINDYTFKDLEDNCPKCNSNLYISEISSIPLKKIKDKTEKGMRSKKPKQDKKEKKFKTKTTLKCENSECDFIKIRNFEPEDYIFKKFDDNACSKCGSRLYIHEISHKLPEKAS